MEASEYRRLAAIENSHWWYRAIHELAIWVVKKGATLRSSTLILDAGCGTGGLTKKLEKFGRVVGLDISSLALSLAKKRKLELIEGSVNSLPFFDEKFDLIASTSVVYHRLVDEDKAINEFYRHFPGFMEAMTKRCIRGSDTLFPRRLAWLNQADLG